MSGLLQSEFIRLRCRLIGTDSETTTTLRHKLEQLRQAGFEKDDLFAVAIPLLMQGKVRLDVGDTSERLELEDQSQRQTRPNAVHIFEHYLAEAHTSASHSQP